MSRRRWPENNYVDSTEKEQRNMRRKSVYETLKHVLDTESSDAFGQLSNEELARRLMVAIEGPEEK